jgi:peptidoglycan/xylan/chitin deacetylase (PgdA/CDA1 family)
MSSISRRDFLKLGGAALLSAALAPVTQALAATPTQTVLYHGSLKRPKIALSYDDCHLVTMLQKLEKTLERHPQVHITLFPVGEAIVSTEAKDPGIWKRFFQKGHEIGYHSFYHDNLELFKTEDVLRDYDRCMDALRAALGTEPQVRFARPPFGNVSQSFLNLCRIRGLVCTMWSWGWGSDSSADAMANIVPKTKYGDIVLMHTRSMDMSTTEAALPWLAQRKISAVTLRELYRDLQLERIDSAGCDADANNSLTRTCLD